MLTWAFSLLLIKIATLCWSVKATAISLDEVENQNGLISIPIVGISRKISNAPPRKFEKVGAEQSLSIIAPLENIDAACLMNASIGTPPQPFTLLLDTGSSTTWVPKAGCGGSCGDPRHTFAPDASSTFQQTNMSFNVRYGLGFSQGFYAKDTFTFSEDHSVPNTQFAVSELNGPELAAVGVDGIIGIGPEGLSKYDNPQNAIVPTLVSSMKNSDVINKNMFSIYFELLDNTKRATGRLNGNIVFGGVDLSKVENKKINYIPITSNTKLQDFWAVDINKITVRGQAINYETGLPSVIDTGSTTMILPKDVIAAIFSKVEGLGFDNNGQRLVPCNSTDLVPFTFTMGSHDFILNPQEYLFPFSVAGGMYKSREYCYTYLQESSSNVGVVILGYGFLQHFVSVYDADNKQIGLGRVVHK